MKLILLLSCYVLCTIWGIRAFDEMDIFERPSSARNVGAGVENEGGKNLKCWECTTNSTIVQKRRRDLCPDDFSNVTQLTQCHPADTFCFKQVVKGGSIYGCGYKFEDWVQQRGNDFKEEIKMNGCFDTLQNVTSFRKVCFCDSDGCNSYSYQEDQKDTNGSSLKKVSLVLFSLVAMRFAF
eukprot:05729.XXX_15238_14624_1 [CDS] Oithona nana genome sequencing.